MKVPSPLRFCLRVLLFAWYGPLISLRLARADTIDTRALFRGVPDWLVQIYAHTVTKDMIGAILRIAWRERKRRRNFEERTAKILHNQLSKPRSPRKPWRPS